MEMRQFDIIIGGGSFVGLALALALAKSAPGTFRIALVERVSAEEARAGRSDTRTVALTVAAKQMLEALGIWDRVAQYAQPVLTIDITDSELEMPIRSVLLNFDADAEPEGPTAYILENVHLLRELYNAVEPLTDISIFSPVTVDAIDLGDANASATLSTGETLSAKLIVAADGRRSSIRQMAGIKTVEWKSDQVGIVGTVAHGKPHEGRAVQHFLPSGPFAILPMVDDRCSLVWTEKADEAQRVMSLSKDDQLAEVQKRMGWQLGALSLVGELTCRRVGLSAS